MDNYAFISDVHGCFTEMKELISKIPSKYTLVFLGDLCDKGPDSIRTLNEVSALMRTKGAVLLKSNHMDKLVRYLKGNPVTINNGLEVTVAEFEKLNEKDRTKFKETVLNMDEKSKYFLKFKSKNKYCVAVHAGWRVGTESFDLKKINDVCALNLVSPSVDGIVPDWIKEYCGLTTVIRGHAVYSLDKVLELNNVFSTDTGCVYGGKLTATLSDSLSTIQVKAKKEYTKYKKLFTL